MLRAIVLLFHVRSTGLFAAGGLRTTYVVGVVCVYSVYVLLCTVESISSFRWLIEGLFF